jgi:hypothetical protein
MPRLPSRARLQPRAGHDLPALAREPGALGNGRPFRDWALPPGLGQIRRQLAGHAAGDRQFVDLLASVAGDGLEAVEPACREAPEAQPCSRDVARNLLARRRRPPIPPPVATPLRLALAIAPSDDCERCDAPRCRPPRAACWSGTRSSSRRGP